MADVVSANNSLIHPINTYTSLKLMDPYGPGNQNRARGLLFSPAPPQQPALKGEVYI
jgi:hypothetical protein